MGGARIFWAAVCSRHESISHQLFEQLGFTGGHRSSRAIQVVASAYLYNRNQSRDIICPRKCGRNSRDLHHWNVLQLGERIPSSRTMVGGDYLRSKKIFSIDDEIVFADSGLMGIGEKVFPNVTSARSRLRKCLRSEVVN